MEVFKELFLIKEVCHQWVMLISCQIYIAWHLYHKAVLCQPNVGRSCPISCLFQNFPCVGVSCQCWSCLCNIACNWPSKILYPFLISVVCSTWKSIHFIGYITFSTLPLIYWWFVTYYWGWFTLLHPEAILRTRSYLLPLTFVVTLP